MKTEYYLIVKSKYLLLILLSWQIYDMESYVI